MASGSLGRGDIAARSLAGLNRWNHPQAEKREAHSPPITSTTENAGNMSIDNVAMYEACRSAALAQ